MVSLRTTILRLFNTVDPEGLADQTGMPDEYLPEVDDLLQIVRASPPQDVESTVTQVHQVLQQNFCSKYSERQFPPTLQERRLGRMIWQVLQESSSSVLGEESSENGLHNTDCPEQT